MAVPSSSEEGVSPPPPACCISVAICAICASAKVFLQPLTTMPAITGKRGREEEPVTPSEASPSFSHAPLSYFALEKLTPKGRRKNVDNGDPHDRSRPLVKVGTASVGSWHCTEGVWDSAAPRPTTESFYVLTGEASVTDLDGTRHSFGPGDTVVLPKGWSGRWDVTKAIHKVWVVHDHEDVKGASVAASVTPPESFATPEMTQQARPPTGKSPGWSAHRHSPTGCHAATGCPRRLRHHPCTARVCGRTRRTANRAAARARSTASVLRPWAAGHARLVASRWSSQHGQTSPALGSPSLPGLFLAAAQRAAHGSRRPLTCTQ